MMQLWFWAPTTLMLLAKIWFRNSKPWCFDGIGEYALLGFDCATEDMLVPNWFFWNGTDWEYHTKETMHRDITLPDKDGVPYVVTWEEPSSAYKSLGVTVTLTGDQSAQEEILKQKCDVIASKIRAAKCDKTSCLNSFNIDFMPLLSYSMLATQFSEKQWSQIVSPAIHISNS